MYVGHWDQALLHNKDLLGNGGKTKTGDKEKQNKQCPHLQSPEPTLCVCWSSHLLFSFFFTTEDVFQLSFNLRGAEWESAQ